MPGFRFGRARVAGIVWLPLAADSRVTATTSICHQDLHLQIRALTIRLSAILASMLPAVSQAADLDGAGLSLAWALPFAGVLLSIAVLPLLAPAMWHHHFGKIAGAWALAFLLPFAALHGAHAALAISVHSLVAEYITFIILLTALFTVDGGI